jgi:hypothetical protein
MAFSKENFLENNFINFDLIEYNNDYLIDYQIPLRFQYRPDVISYDLYRDTTYQILISFLNKIDNSPEGYYAGRILKVIKPERIDSI